MKVFYCDSFVGLYPVGTLAIIVASDSNFAAKGLEIQLKKEGMAQSISQDQMIEIDISEPSAKVILNGDY